MTTTTPAVASAWRALGDLGVHVERAVTRVRWTAVAACALAALFVAATWVRMGVGVTVVNAGLIGALAVAVWLRRSHPQVAGVLASSTLAVLAVIASTMVVIAATGVVPVYPLVAGLELVAVTVLVVVAPHRGVHVGWSVAVAQGTILSAVPVWMCAPNSGWSSAATALSFVVAVAGIYFRSRKAQPRNKKLWRARIARAAGIVLVAMIGGMGLTLGAAPPQAKAFLGIGDYFETKANDLICSFTRPDLTQEPTGTGPESLFASRNLGKVKAAPNLGNPSEVPNYSDQIGNFDRLGPNYSLDNYTLFEIAGLRGLKFVNWQKNSDGQEVCSIMPWMSVVTGNLVMKVNEYILQFVIYVKEISQSGRPLQFLYDKTLPYVDAMFTYLFAPMGAVMLMLGFIRLMIVGTIKNGARGALGEVAGIAGVLLLGGLLFTGLAGAGWNNPNRGWFLLASVGDTMVASLNSQVAEVTFDTIVVGSSKMMCQKPRPVPTGPNEDEAFAAAVPGQRYSSCILAESLAYRPWAIGQFGSAGNNEIKTATRITRYGDPHVGGRTDLIKSKDDKAGQGLPCYNNYRGCTDMRSYLIAQEGGPSFAAARVKCMDGKSDYTHLVQCDPYHAVAYELDTQSKSTNQVIANNAADMQRSYQGMGSFPHLTQALVALVGTGVIAAGVGTISLMCLWWQLMLFGLFLFGPFYLLVASFPGQSRRALEYVSNFAGTFAHRLAYGILASLMIVIVALIFSAPMSMGFKILALFGTLLMMLKMIRKTGEMAKVKGSTMQNPGMSAGTALALYGGAKVAGKAAGATARGTAKTGAFTARQGRNALIGRPQKDTPTAPTGGAPVASGGGDGGSGLSVRGRPIGGIAGFAAPKAAAGARRAGSAAAAAGRHAGQGAAAVGRGARFVASPARAAASEAAANTENVVRYGRLGSGAARARQASANAASGLGRYTQKPVSRLESAMDASGSYVRSAGAGAAREAKGVASLIVPRSYATGLSEERRTALDNQASASWIGSKLYGDDQAVFGRSTMSDAAHRTDTRRRAASVSRYQRAAEFRDRFGDK
ncbi:hypothetical protein [Gordonia otitidis]|uniref:TrbL/VirB6 plasmid conjugal transfer protein n=1 Tax=Gordonia otitidis (strain DSM 44809 / CCUG 52243 / JCM 12355 / NBRC 100426 / IFM 10032) TaxID=1108044 RepID=H5TIA6_GORO1|nr:hypothetical protein [Gordonia otitidis]GAB33214.1 hypothetical protein GOOTI_051_00050 [Gordonia otitidis NBRC 100426]